MAITSFNGKQFWDRMTLAFTDRKHYHTLLHKGNAEYLKVVPYSIIMLFTALQFGWLAGLWALVTWAGVAGVAFPVPIVALIPIRMYVLPYLFKSEYLEALDPLEKDCSLPPNRSRRNSMEDMDCQVQPPA
ncbi:hypothetical protein DUNSADRAFT_12627 [Dunaliella salina]|uniref:Bicarbonate transporter-like transmembrane domain-containing protein n=1 Tax=Dunaliella salina TaxID=3046 RepID=A0ABQ7GAZ1_DUNSA|nr:hypothetical protein DUNSADRAFT_12627 [Dunaliella salina]|eukprot:KAF5831757.1 hypothetical protein DUNSADRAFT_12627 [Dunaliella salina]